MDKHEGRVEAGFSKGLCRRQIDFAGSEDDPQAGDAAASTTAGAALPGVAVGESVADVRDGSGSASGATGLHAANIAPIKIRAARLKAL